MRFICGSLLFFLLVCPILRAETHYYVSTAGDDTWSGRLAEPNAQRTDGPFRTLLHARDTVRANRNKVRQQDVEPVTIEVRGGTYTLDRSLELIDEDGGSPGAPVIWKARAGDLVRISGGCEIVRWFRVDDETVRTRMQPAVRDKIRQANLRLHGVKDFGKFFPSGFGRPVQPAPLELFFDSRPMTIARWPNHEWAKTTAVLKGEEKTAFLCENAPMERWTRAEDLWVHGFWNYDWADTYERVAAIDLARRRIETAPPHGAYGYGVGKRFYAVNLVEEIDEPGEYWVDRQAGKIYFWSPESLDQHETWVSVLESPLIRLTRTRNVRIEGFTFECTRGAGAIIDGGQDNLISHCTFRNIGTIAVSIGGDYGDSQNKLYQNPTMERRGGSGNGVADCEIYDSGEGGIALSGGDRKTLTPAGNYAERNHIYRYQRRCFTYRGGIHLDGVGNRAVHNLIHDSPHTAIFCNGNDHLIEFNEVHNVCEDSGDAGAFYIGRDFTQRGHIVRYNYFHDIHGVKGQKGFTDVMGVYLDDCASGLTITGNVFRNVSRAIMVGGGRDNIIENNVFHDCHIAIHVDARATSWAKFWWNGQDKTLTDRLAAVKHDQPPYSEKYPPLKTLLADEPALPKHNRIVRNVAIDVGKWLELLDHVKEETLNLEGNVVSGASAGSKKQSTAAASAPAPASLGFMDLAVGNYTLKPDSPLKAQGFEPIPFEKIGLGRKVSTDRRGPAAGPRDPSAPPDE